MLDSHVFGVVNYGTADSVIRYFYSVKSAMREEKFKFLVCDNFSNPDERVKLDNFKRIHDNFILLYQENIGYGRGLNVILSYITEKYYDQRLRVILSNSDLELNRYVVQNFKERTAYIPVINGRRSLFLNTLQKNILILMKMNIFSEYFLGFLFRTAVLKIFRYCNAQPWTCHGSVFILDYTVSEVFESIFNEDTFLYSEELEFGSYVEFFGYEWSFLDYSFSHRGSESISKTFSSQYSRNKLYHDSFRNWVKRWSY